MKGRSQRPPAAPAAAEPPEDWGDGAWTVDCSCGVTFDDGEEMVSCDECGVWVHTRCARFTRGQPSFACHKCKRPAPSSAGAASDDAEETEVAQLLVELPTKAAGSGADPPPPPPPLAAPRRPPYRLWAEVPMEERVHVQGVPGGDPAIFRGLSSVFTSQLWRCTGYVPKKFNFRYREFPCWDDEAKGEKEKEEEECENPANRGADVLFSLSKEIVPYIPAASFERRAHTEMAKKRDGGRALFGNRSHSSGKKERSKLRVFGVNSSKRRKDEQGDGKDRSAKKKARSGADKTLSGDRKRGSGPMLDMNKDESCDDGVPLIDNSNIQGEKKEDKSEDETSDRRITSQAERYDGGNKPKHIKVVIPSQGTLSDKVSKQKGSVEALLNVEQSDQLEPLRNESFSDVDTPPSRGEGSISIKVPAKEEDVGNDVNCFKQLKDEDHCETDADGGYCHVQVNSEDTERLSDNAKNNLGGASTDLDSDGAILSSKQDVIKVKTEGGNDRIIGKSEMLHCPEPDKKLYYVDVVVKTLQSSIDCSSENFKQHEDVRSLPLPSDEHKPETAERVSEGCEKIIDGVISRTSEPMHTEKVMEGSEGSLTAEKSSNNVGGPVTLSGLIQSDPLPSTHKLVAAIGDASSALSAQVLSRSVPGSGNSPGITALNSKASHLTKQQQPCTNERRDNAANAVSSEEDMREGSRQPAKDHRKSSQNSIYNSSVSASASAAKPPLSDSSKKQVCPPSNASTTENMASLSGSGEASGSSQPQISPVQIKLKSSSSSQKNDRFNQPISQPSTKVFNHSITMHGPTSVNAITTLSDEELALLLHQELNSSPRVPRVPRVRQAAGMQLVPPTGTSMLSKRTSSSGSKDHLLGSRRKNKEDGSRESSRNSREVIGETKKIGRLKSSHDQKHQDSAFMTDCSSRNDAQNRSPDTETHTKKNTVASAAGSKSCSASSFEDNGQNVLSIRSSPRCVSDDDIGLTPRTLPGLIGDIINKNRDIILEELCDAVRPHWHNLRKPNGERYAYSSHSQAVLDCLRNRSEWAHLIGRGPKTNSSKRRRKPDAETPTAESESEEAKDKASKGKEDKNKESHREDYPKGKRKARKRRRLELRGRAVKDRKRRKQGVVSDDDDDDDDDHADFSHSSNEGEGPFSEDESQGTGLSPGGAEPSSSSSDADTE